MIVWLLLFFAGLANGASIPPQPVIPTASACLQGCFETGSVVNAALDLSNFKSIAVDIENFCNLNAALLKCGRECPVEQIPELEARTEASSFICVEKVEEFRLVSGCLEGAEDVTAKCAMSCEVPTDIPLRLDSSPAASVNPTVFLDGVAGTCKKHICVVKCAQEGFNKECAGSGDLFKDIARQQIRSGIDRLAEESSNENATTVKLMAQNYLKNLPAECAFLKDLDEFSKAMDAVSFKEKNETESSTIASATTAFEAENADTDGMTETISEKKTTTQPEIQASDEPAATSSSSTTSAREEATSTINEEEHTDGFMKESNEEIATMVVSSTLKAEEEAEEVPLGLAPTQSTPVETSTEIKETEAKFNEEKTEIAMDVNALDETTTVAPTEPVIVVDDTSETVSENDIQAGIKEEVKSSSVGLMIFSSLLATGAALLLI
ncbi:hypothetical protein RB195_012663 [Necator americanus]|uniref:Chondroitin proteoglycan 4 domain-containing protein n=1 Tax=Necator americanus TaxID=51031 RepID=A0ABR1DS86_NECAM